MINVHKIPDKLPNKYNYVFIFCDKGLFDILFYDLTMSASAQFIAMPDIPWKIDNTILSTLCRIHFSRKINRIVPLPFKQLWNKKRFNFHFNQNFDKTKSFCFIIDARCYEAYNDIMIDYLRRTFNNCKIICYLSDLVCTHSFVPFQKKHLFDAFFSSEKSDAEKYGFTQLDVPYSRLKIQSTLPESDLFFVGNAKNRLKTILTVYEQAVDNGLKCDFHITNIKESDRLYEDRIIYNKPLEYIDVLQHIDATKCILEVLQENGNSPTIRPYEAVCYNKKLLTNCKELMYRDYYNSEYMHIFSDPGKIDFDFIKNKPIPDYRYTGQLSPLETIKKIDKNIDSILV